MDVFDLRNRLVSDYRDYTRSFIRIRDPRIKGFVTDVLDAEGFWPEPLLQLNPTFRPGGTIDDLVAEGVLHEECSRIFRIGKSDTDPRGRPLLLHRHQREAILKVAEGRSCVLTTGTGSGKSLAFIVPIVDHVLRHGTGRGIRAIVVYPMNALANSQAEELGKFLDKGYPEGRSPVRFARYTGQERGAEREAIRSEPPDVLLTNYMMLELMLTRSEDRALVRAAQGLGFLVFDELHTYRGRQGADVAMLIRRCRHAFGNRVASGVGVASRAGVASGAGAICIGTSATMASGGSSEEQRQEVAKVSRSLFGVDFTPEQVIGETLERATPEIDPADPSLRDAIREAVVSDEEPPSDYESFRSHPLASWIESTFGVRKEADTGRLIRQMPRRLGGDGEPEAVRGHDDGPARRRREAPPDGSHQPSAAAELAALVGASPQPSAAVSDAGAPSSPTAAELADAGPQPSASESAPGAPSSPTPPALVGAGPQRCAAVLRRWLLRGADLYRSESSRFSIFAFRLHQFLTRGDTVWATLEPEAHRHLEIAKKAAKPGEPDKPLFPLVFCRHCGTAYYRVRVTAVPDAHGQAALLPREDRREADDDGGHDAYLHLSEEAPWPRAAGPALLARLPEALKETTAQGVERVRPAARRDVPEPVFADPAGRIVPEGEGAPAALIHGNFLFCLEPSCGVAYTRSQRSERFKLAILGVDNRSTATTILAVRSLIELQRDRNLVPEARKLLSFTDNRQDASLQAGHFNDFAGRPAALGAVPGLRGSGRSGAVASRFRGAGSRTSRPRPGLPAQTCPRGSGGGDPCIPGTRTPRPAPRTGGERGFRSGRRSGRTGGRTGASPRRAVASRPRRHAPALRGLRGRSGRARTGAAAHPGRPAAGHRILPLPRPRTRLAGHRAQSGGLRAVALRVRGAGRGRGPARQTELWGSGFSVQEGRGSRRFVEAPAALRLAPAEAREEILRTLLDVLRRALAVKVDVLDPRKQHDLVERTKPRLLEGTVWYLDDERELTGSVVAWPRPRRQGARGGFFVSSHGAYGQYVKRTLESHPAPEQPRAQPLGHADTGEPSSVANQSRTVRGRTQPPRRADTGAIIRFLFLALKRYGIVEQVRTGRDGDDPGYQLNADALRWLPGDGEDRPPARACSKRAGFPRK